jgi:cytochrome P450
MYYVQELHEKYGSYVIIAPSEVSTTSPEGFARINRTGANFNKSSFYEKLVGFGRPVLFTMTDPKIHGNRRKMFARAFSKTHLRQYWEDSVHETIKFAVSRMKQDNSGHAVDILKWWTLMATDISSQIMFGESFHTIEAGEVCLDGLVRRHV